jgi:hypothetical protein
MQYPLVKASKNGTQSFKSLLTPDSFKSIFPPINLSAFLYQSGTKVLAGAGGISLMAES